MEETTTTTLCLTHARHKCNLPSSIFNSKCHNIHFIYRVTYFVPPLFNIYIHTHTLMLLWIIKRNNNNDDDDVEKRYLSKNMFYISYRIRNVVATKREIFSRHR